MQVYGREAVLRTCTGALAAAQAGRGRVLLLAGEAGIGKTTVAQVLAEAAAAGGATTRWSACWDGGSVPFGPWIDLLRRPGGDVCAQVAERLAEEAEDAGSDPAAIATVRRRTFARVCDALRAAADERPQFVVIEDLHWADPTSLLLLRAVTAQVPTMRLVVLGTCRDDELPDDHPLWSLGGGAERIDLDRLGPEDVRRLLAEVLDREPTAEEASAVDTRAGGNPLFVAHVARLIASGAPLGVPAGVRTVLSRRLARLPGPCHGALGVGSVFGAEFAPAAVADVLGWPETEVLDALDHAATARIALPVPDRSDRWAFTHALLQEARYSALGSAERVTLHRRACDVLAAGGRTPARTLAQHAFRGRFDADDPRPAEFALTAAEEAQARLAAEEAAGFYEGAISRAPTGAAGDDLRARAWLGLGDARMRSGDTAGAGTAFEAVAALAHTRGDAELLARAALGFGAGLGGFEVRMFDQRQTAMLEAAAAALPADSALRPWVLARLSVALSFMGSEARRLALADEALSLARAGSDAAAVGAALASRCDAVAGPAHATERLGLAGEITGIGLRIGDRRLELLGRRLRVAALAELCDLDGVDAEAAAFERTAALLGDPLYAWYGPLWRGMRALGHGWLADAERLRDEAAALGAAAASANARVLTGVLDLFIGLETGELAAFRARFDALADEFHELLLANGGPMLAHVDALLGVPGWEDRARAVLAGVDRMPVDAEWLATVAPLAYLAEVLGGREEAASLYRLFASFAGLGVVEGIAAVHRGPTDGYLMVLAGLAGDEAAALAHLDRALALGARNGPLVLAGIQLRAAGVLRRLGGRHAARADALEAEARTTFDDLGLPARAASRQGIGPEHTSPRPSPAVPARDRDPGAALVREGDTWAATWGGRTVRIRHAKGVADLAVLLTRPGRDIHVRELEGITGSPTGPSAQAALDPAAVAAYRRRLRDVEEDLDEADRHGDLARAARLGAERDALVAELTAAFGLGGRPRAAGPDPDDRLRKAVSARIKATLDRLERLHAPLGRHLRNSVRTGVWCSYHPERPVEWKVTGDPR